MGLSTRFYEVGSSIDCIQGNRKIELGLYEEFMNFEREFESFGIEIGIPEHSDAGVEDHDDDGGVPQLIPIENNACEDNVDENNNKAKKRKDGDDKKRKKKKKRKDENRLAEPCSLVDGAEEKGDCMESENGALPMSGTVIMNLQKQFETAAAETDPQSNEHSDGVTPPVAVKHSKRAKRAKMGDDDKTNGTADSGGDV